MDREELISVVVSELNKDRIDVVSILTHIGTFCKSQPGRQPADLDKIVNTACKLFCVDPSLIFTETRKREVVLSRYFIYHQLRKQGLTFKRIGEIMHKDHATIIHGIRALKNDIETKYNLVYSKFTEFEALVNNA